jgi:cardiolipin synthase
LNTRDIPNVISILRILLVAPVAILLLTEHYTGALVLFAVAGLSDGIDGFLARRYDWRSRLGAFLDPFADKLLMLVCYLSLGWLGHLPVWLVATVIGRDVLLVLGAATYQFVVEQMDIHPSYISKINTVFQILLVVLVLLSLAGAPLPAPVIDFMIVTVFVTTVLSGAGYLWHWGKRMLMALRKEKTGD